MTTQGGKGITQVFDFSRDRKGAFYTVPLLTRGATTRGYLIFSPARNPSTFPAPDVFDTPLILLKIGPLV